MTAPALSIGMFGDPIRTAQQKLRRAGIYISPADTTRGFFGASTREAVLNFQQQQSLPASGEIDPATAVALDALSAPAHVFPSTLEVPSALTPRPIQASPSSLTGIVGPPVAPPLSNAPRPLRGPPAAGARNLTPIEGPHLTSVMLAATVAANLQKATPASSFVEGVLNAALKRELTSAAANAGQSALASLLQGLPKVDVMANRDLSIKAFVAKEIRLPDGGAAGNTVEDGIAQLSTQTTVGALLGLDTPIKDNSLFGDEVAKVGLSTLLGTSSALSARSQVIDDFITQYANYQGPIRDFWLTLGQNSEFKTLGRVDGFNQH